MTYVLVCANRYARGWPDPENASACAQGPLSSALVQRWPDDAHFAPYSSPLGRRLRSAAIGQTPIIMTAGVFDVDAHGVPDPAVWWAVERTKIDALRSDLPGLYVYRTRGGYRILGVLPAHYPVDSVESAQAWRVLYLAWVAYLRRAHGIGADPSCSDWTRLYRLPHATRDPGGRPENLEVIGHAEMVGPWAPRLRPRDVPPVPPKRRKKKGAVPPGFDARGVLFGLLAARGMVDEDHARTVEGERYVIACPFEAEHTSGTTLDGSTILFVPRTDEGETLGFIHCSHAHCRGRSPGEYLRALEAHGSTQGG